MRALCPQAAPAHVMRIVLEAIPPMPFHKAARRMFPFLCAGYAALSRIGPGPLVV